MTGPPRDWDKELADVDKAMARQAPESAAQPAATPVPVASPPPPARGPLAKTWFTAGLGLLLAVALPLWPYTRACGMQLIFYLGAVALTLLVGMWGAMTSWRSRRGVAHVLSLLTIVWAAILLAGDVLPRIGYAKVERTWICP